MYSVEEIWEEQERQYNQLMQEDDQYCHPESFRWGFEHGFEYALSKFGWRHGSERPLPATGKKIIVYYKGSDGVKHAHTSFLNNLYEWFGVPKSVGDNLMWCYAPKED